jgi:hypothetical protein
MASPFLNSTLDGGDLSVSRTYRCTAGERAPDAQWTGGRMDPIAGLDAMEKRKILHCLESNPDRQAHSYPYSG